MQWATTTGACDILLVSGNTAALETWYATPCYCCEAGCSHGNLLFWSPRGSAPICPACWTDLQYQKES